VEDEDLSVTTDRCVYTRLDMINDIDLVDVTIRGIGYLPSCLPHGHSMLWNGGPESLEMAAGREDRTTWI